MNNQLLIHGKWEESKSGNRYSIINPATEEVFETVPRANSQDIDRAIRSASDALIGPWRDFSPNQRGRLLYLLADAIEANRSVFAEIETINVGKPLKESISNVNAAISYFRYYAGTPDKLEGESIPLGRDYINFTQLEPLGVTAHIVPFNFPLSIACRSLAPALAAGNTAVVKPSALTPLTTLRLAELCLEVGFPEGVVNVVTGYGSEAGIPLVQHPLVRGITFTGAVSTGKAILKMAADGIKSVVAELGGKSPQVIFSDANLDKAIEDTLRGAFQNAGQVCSASTRLIIERSIHEEYIERLRSRTQQLDIGPGIEDRDMGPLISENQYNQVTDYVKVGIKEGATLITGGQRPKHLSKGYFLEPSIFDKVQPMMKVAQEEIFGPVLCALTFDTDEQAIEIANNTPFGLVAGIYTNDIDRALKLARDIQAGQVWINGWAIGGTETPFGGYKESGLGREKGLVGLMNYVQIKNVGIRISH